MLFGPRKGSPVDGAHRVGFANVVPVHHHDGYRFGIAAIERSFGHRLFVRFRHCFSGCSSLGYFLAIRVLRHFPNLEFLLFHSRTKGKDETASEATIMRSSS